MFQVIKVDDTGKAQAFQPGWYVVAEDKAHEYLAYTGPLDYEQSKLDAELIASILNRVTE